MSYPALLRQPKWVLQSASTDRPGPEQLTAQPDADALQAWALIKPGWQAFHAGEALRAQQLWREAIAKQPHNLLLLRALNQCAPQLLRQGHISRRGAPWGSRIAIVLPGELRCLAQSESFFHALSRHADLFVCTSAAFAKAAQRLPAAELQVVDPEPSLPMGAMHQWHKLALALAMVRAREKHRGTRYTHILKLRTDYHHAQPRHLLKELVAADGLVAASDKVFGGQRDLMLFFEAFPAAITAWFDQRQHHYWPINPDPILRSDDSIKWYGMAFPKQLVGQPATVDALRQVLIQGGSALAEALLRWQPPTDDPALTQSCMRFVQGHPRFASEVCFARFLNFNGIAVNSTPGVSGFLRSDRLHA